MSKKAAPWLIIGGGVTALSAFFASKKASETSEAVERAVSIPPSALPPGKLPTVNVRLTGFWPYDAHTPAEKLMEGGVRDRWRQPIYTLEMYQQGKAPYVTVAGDYTIWPAGQRISINHWPGVVFRVTDTGSHFFGAKKVYRVAGREPLDIAVQTRNTHVPKKDSVATIHVGDTWGKTPSPKAGPAVVQAGGFKGQNVVLGAEVAAAEAIVGAYFDALKEGMR